MSLVVRNVRLRGTEGVWDLGIDGDRIAEVSRSVDAGNLDEVDGGGSLVLPGLVNAHQHLDKCMLGDVMRENESQTLQEAIAITWEHKRSYTVQEIADRAEKVVDQSIINGTTAIRAFADVDTVGGLTPVEGLLELKRRVSDRISLEVVAFPQEGIIRDPGCDTLMEQAMAAGADVVGGLPWYEHTDQDGRDHIDFCIDLAKRNDAPIHMLADDTDDPTSRTLEYLAVQTLREGWEGRVTASHCGALSAYDHTHASRVISLVERAQISIATNTHVSLVLAGRNDRGTIRRGTTRIKELLGAGVNVLSAQDDVKDPYYPFGRPDQLEVAQYAAHVAQLTQPSELEQVIDMVTTNSAKSMELAGYGVGEGDRADLVIVGAPSVGEALRLIPPRRAVIYGGKVLAESSVTVARHW